MSSTYPAVIQTFTTTSGTQTLGTVDHNGIHTTENDTLVALQSTVGTTAGTNVLKNYNAGDLVPKTNNQTFGTPTLQSPIILLGSDATGDIYYGTNGTVTRLPIGSTSQVLTVTGGVPVWSAPAVSTGVDMWTLGTETLTRTSGTSLTVVGDFTTRYTKGTRIKITQGGTSTYGAVYSSVLASGTTTVNTIGNNDYNFGTASITAQYYSYAASPAGYPTIFNFSPIQTGYSGTPPVVAYFSILGNVCYYTFSNTNNGTSNANSLTITVPCQSLAGSMSYTLFLSQAVDNSSPVAAPLAQLAANSGTINVFISQSAGAWTTSGGKRVNNMSGWYFF